MNTYIACGGSLVVNADLTLSCDSWQQVTADQLAQDAGMKLSHDDFLALEAFTVTVFILAGGFKILKNMFLDRPARG